jgi:hypothetical protein
MAMRHFLAWMSGVMRATAIHQVRRGRVWSHATLTFFRRSIIAYSWWAAVFQAPLIAWIVCWLLFTPSPGFAVAVLAFAAGVMAVRTEHFTRTEQVAWIIIAGALCFVELRAISKDRDEHEALEASIRWEDRSNRKQERRQFSALIDSGQRLLSTEQRLSSRTMDALTGGESFCYVEILEFGMSNGVLQAMLLQKGINPIFNVQITVTDLDVLKDLTRSRVEAETRFSFQFVRAGTFMTKLFQFRPGDSVQSKDYSVFIFARNGDFTERLRLRRVNGHWLSAERVDASYYSGKGGLVLEHIDRGFPVDVLDADSDWKAADKLKRITVR